MNKLVKNASWIIVCKVIQSLLGFVISMLTARYLGPSNYGLINYAQSLVVFVTPIMQLGFNNILVQEIVNTPEEDGEILGTTLFFSFLSSLTCMIGVCTFAFIANRDETTTVIVCVLFSLNLVIQAFEQLEYWFQAKLLSKYRAIVGLIAYTLVSVYKIYLLITHKSVYWFAISYSIDYLIISISLYIIYRRLGGKRLTVSSQKAKAMLAKCYPYIFSAMMITIFTQTDRIMLKQMLNASATGYYSAAVLLSGITSFVFQAVIDSFRPKLFEDAKVGTDKFEKGIVQLYSLVIYAALLQCLAMTLLARPIVMITYGIKYEPAILLLRIVCWISTFSYVGVIRNIWILVENKQKLLFPINAIGALSNVVLNLVLIPVWGASGAAFASLITQSFTNFFVNYFFKAMRHNNNLIIKALNYKIAIDVLIVVVNTLTNKGKNNE